LKKSRFCCILYNADKGKPSSVVLTDTPVFFGVHRKMGAQSHRPTLADRKTKETTSSCERANMVAGLPKEGDATYRLAFIGHFSE